MDANHSMRKQNRQLTLDAADNHLLTPTVAHTHGKTRIPKPEEEKLYHGNEVTEDDIKQAMNRGFKQGRLKFIENSSFSSTKVYEGDDEDFFTDEETDNESNEDEILVEVSQEENMEGLKDTNSLLNDGRSKMTGQSRFRRFKCVADHKLTMDIDCEVGNDDCVILSIGQRGKFKPRKGKIHSVTGVIMFMSFPLGVDNSGEKSSVSHHPMNKLCKNHKLYNLWIQTKAHGLVICNEVIKLQ